VGTQYRSAVCCQNEAQETATINMISQLNAQAIWPNPIVTQVNDAVIFYAAEDYHQYYFDKNPFQPYCLAVAAPKAAKIRPKYAALIKD
jgi:peptide-methionine (S)-S-oxide reductase